MISCIILSRPKQINQIAESDADRNPTSGNFGFRTLAKWPIAAHGGQRMGAVIPARQRGQGGAFMGKFGAAPAGARGVGGAGQRGGGRGGKKLKTCETENLRGCLRGVSLTYATHQTL